MIYKKPIEGKFGVFSQVSKNMVFGICADTKKECEKLLRTKIGNDVCKYRWSYKLWTAKHLEKEQLKNEEYKKYIEQCKIFNQEKENFKKYIKDNWHRLTKKQQERFKKEWLPIQSYTFRTARNVFEDVLNGKAYKDKKGIITDGKEKANIQRFGRND